MGVEVKMAQTKSGWPSLDLDLGLPGQDAERPGLKRAWQLSPVRL